MNSYANQTDQMTFKKCHLTRPIKGNIQLNKQKLLYNWLSIFVIDSLMIHLSALSTEATIKRTKKEIIILLFQLFSETESRKNIKGLFTLSHTVPVTATVLVKV